MNLKFYLTFFVFALFNLRYLIAEDDSNVRINQSDYRIGLFGHININQFKSNFTKFPEIPNCCPKFTNGGGLGFRAGLLYEHDSFWSVRAGLSNLSGEFSYKEKTNIIPNGTSVEGEFEHIINTDLMAIFLQPLFNYWINEQFLLNIGFDLSYLITSDFSQKEQISKPVGVGTFLDSLGNDTYSRIRNQFSGKIPDVSSMLMSITVGASYNLPLNKKNSLFLAPEFYFSYGLNNVVKSIEWKINTFSLGLALKYKRPPEPVYKDEYEEIFQIDTIQIAKDDIKQSLFVSGIAKQEIKQEVIDYKRINTVIISRTDTIFNPKFYNLSANINAVGIDTNGREISNPRIVLEEFVSKRLDPLLNYIFFDDNSDLIPDKYKFLGDSEIAGFSENKLYSDSTLGIYYNILNIVGKRLSSNPKANLTIIGCNSNIGNEKGNIDLSKRRAENIKKYLTKMWSINPNRLIVQSRNLPKKASLPYEEIEKIQENRRVELYSDSYEILKPVFSTDTALFSNLEKIKFVPDIYAESGLKNYNISSTIINKGDFANIDGDSPKDEIINIENFYKILKKSTKPITYQLFATDNKYQQKSSEIKQIPIEIVSIEKKRQSIGVDFEINKFSLILFEFDRSDISGNNKSIVDFIKTIAKSDSEIEIVGFTDRTGNDDYNLKLSEKRADATKSTLGFKNANSRGVGETVLIYNNDIPEGRFYCRTVEIMVKTRVK